eukprot:2242910-Karenia_brevis.AAC.1
MYQEGAAYSLGAKTLASLAHFNPEYGSRLKEIFPQATRSLKGWERLAPSTTRDPLPWYGFLNILTSLLSQNKIAQAICILIGFLCYLRPRELTGLKVKQLLPPVESRQKSSSFWTIYLFPESEAVKSKGGRFDDSVQLDLPSFRWLHAYLEVLVNKR